MDAQRPAALTPDERLRAAGLRATAPRVAVLGVLEELDGHPAADELVEVVAARGHHLPRATVYNVLRDLSACGLVMVADTGPGPALYETADEWHHHFVCRSCQAVVDVACVTGAKPCLTPQLVGAEVDEAQVILRGRCSDCAAS